jgi:hypothetical protein
MDHLEHLKLPEEILKKINNTEHEINEARNSSNLRCNLNFYNLLDNQ